VVWNYVREQLVVPTDDTSTGEPDAGAVVPS
jgi:hypothetical protein